MKIALVGYDIEGQASYRYFAHGKNEIVIFDEADQPGAITPEGVEVVSGLTALSELKKRNFDKIIRTPGLSPKKLQGLLHVTTATCEFFAHCPATIIGVTGTKGKGTTCSLISEILTKAGKKVWLVGNIGFPALDILNQIQPTDIVVYELSSFQLWDLKQSPSIAVVLMIEPEHLEVHEDFQDYLQAKKNIALYQGQNDTIIYHPINSYSKYIADASPAVKKIKYMKPEGAHTEGETIVIDEQIICSKDEIGLIGQHNIENVCAAITTAWEHTKNIEAIHYGVTNFKGLPHRLKFVREVSGVNYYDDSNSTTPASAIAALNSFVQPKIIILGGRGKGADFSELAIKIAQSSMRRVFLIGDEAKNIQNAFDKVGFKNYEHFKPMDMAKLVKQTAKLAQAGDAVILSPGCSSRDFFDNYAQRGDQFIEAVKAL